MGAVEPRLPEPDHGCERVDPLPEVESADGHAGVRESEALGLRLALAEQSVDIGSPCVAVLDDEVDDEVWAFERRGQSCGSQMMIRRQIGGAVLWV